MSRKSVARESRRLLREALCDMVAQAAWWRKSPGEESLHDFRISLRRCRGLLRVLRDEFPVRDMTPLRLSLSHAAGRLGAVRDYDVMLLLVDEMARTRVEMKQTEGLVRRIRREQAARHRRAVALFSGPSWARIQQRVDRLLLSPAVAEGARSMDKLVDHEYRRLVRNVVRIQAHAGDEEVEALHVLRVKLRRLRYFGRLMRDHVAKRRQRVIRRIRPAEQQLGCVHDVDILMAWLAKHPRLTPAWLTDRLTRLRARRRREFLRLWNEAGFAG